MTTISPSRRSRQYLHGNEREFLKSSAADDNGSAGIFVDRSKPLPMSGARFVFPRFGFGSSRERVLSVEAVDDDDSALSGYSGKPRKAAKKSPRQTSPLKQRHQQPQQQQPPQTLLGRPRKRGSPVNAVPVAIINNQKVETPRHKHHPNQYHSNNIHTPNNNNTLSCRGCSLPVTTSMLACTQCGTIVPRTPPSSSSSGSFQRPVVDSSLSVPGAQQLLSPSPHNPFLHLTEADFLRISVSPSQQSQPLPGRPHPPMRSFSMGSAGSGNANADPRLYTSNSHDSIFWNELEASTQTSPAWKSERSALKL